MKEIVMRKNIELAKLATGKTHALPVLVNGNDLPVVCCHCLYVNQPQHNFCTSCGFPARQHAELVERFKVRRKAKLKLIRKYTERVVTARNLLYICSLCYALAAFFVVTAANPPALRTLVLMVLALLFFLLGKWTDAKPVSSLLIGFVVVTSFLAINTWSQVIHMFSQLGGVYLVCGQILLSYFLATGLKAAYKAHLLLQQRTPNG